MRTSEHEYSLEKPHFGGMWPKLVHKYNGLLQAAFLYCDKEGIKGSVSSSIPCTCRLLVGRCLLPFSCKLVCKLSLAFIGLCMRRVV